MTYPALPDTFCIVLRDYLVKGKHVWGDLSDGPVSLDEAVDLVIESFDGADAREIELSIKTLRVLEIDGSVVMDRTEDVLSEIGSHTTWRSPCGEIGSFLRVYHVTSDFAAEHIAAE